MDCGEDGRARSALDHRRSEKVGDQFVRGLTTEDTADAEGNMGSTSVASGLSRLSVEVISPVARISLRQPPLNVIDIPMMEELGQSLAEGESRGDVSVIVLSGDGKAVSAGVVVAAPPSATTGRIVCHAP